jgi:hypothetical protein
MTALHDFPTIETFLMIPNDAGSKIAGKGEDDKLVVKSTQLPLMNLKIEDQRDCKIADLNSKNFRCK